MSDDISIVLQSVDEIINVTIDDSVYAITNWGGIYGSLADQTDLQAALDAKVDDSEVVTVATASKLLKLDANAALPADITGNAATATEVAWSGVSGRPATYPPASHSVDSHSDWPATVSMVEVGYLNGVSSGVQGQLDGKEPANANIQQHIADTLNPHGVTASQVGLGNVTNAAQVLRTEMGTASGVATLGADGKVPSGQLPSYVDVYEPADATILKDADIGVTVQAYDADLTSWAGVAPSSKQDALVSGTNIKTINNESLLGSGNITVAASGVVVTVSGTLTIYVTQQTTLTITNYDSATNYSVSAVSGTASITGDTITYTAGNTAGTDTLTITAGASSRDISITVNAAGVATPTNSSPANGATDQDGPSLTLTASAFAWVGLSDTHASSDWQLSTVSDFSTTVTHSDADTTNKTSWTVTVSTSQTYYWRVRYRGASGRVSDWSTGTSLTTKATFGGLIGTQGGQGFGVGVYIGTLPSGFSALTGTTDTASDNYGNYQYSDGSTMCFVPKFYYRIGSASSPRYATYGANAVDIAGIDTFADETAANAAGYVLHRAFIDGGSVKSGFFIDKYLCSKNGTTSGKSVKNGDPISLTTNDSYNPSSTMTGCTGILADAVVLSRARGAGVFNVASIFI